MITIQIGNTDDKLGQREWAHFTREVNEIVNIWAHTIHFTGYSAPAAAWQNAAWCFEPDYRFDAVTDRERLQERLAFVANRFGQDSIAWTEGETVFIAAKEEADN